MLHLQHEVASRFAVPFETLVLPKRGSCSGSLTITRAADIQDQEMISMLHLFNIGSHQSPAERSTSAKPAPAVGMTVEVKQDDDKLIFQATLPGFAKDDIKVPFSPSLLGRA